jgi:hypothetical protein
MAFRWAAFHILFLVRTLQAEPPPLDALYPAGGERGTTNAVTAIGKFDAWPPKVWIGGEGIEFVAETNKGKFTVTISRDAIPGPRLVRLYNEDGTSDPRTFVIGDTREISEAEPNNHFAKAQRISESPVTINGRLDKNGDVDSFAIELSAGQWLDTRVDCYTLMSKVDAVLRLATTNGQQLAWNHDFTTLDPRIVWRAPSNQIVVLQLFGFAYPPGSDIGFTGGDAVVYRLHVGVTDTVQALCDSPTEHEPNDTTEKAEPVELPAVVRGSIGADADEDRFRFSAEKDEWIEARVDAASFGSPLDAWLKIEDANGNQLARSDDVDGSRDPRLEWKAPTNGIFVVAIGSVTHRGNKEFCYRLSVARAEPDFRATLAANALVLATSATNELKIEVKRLRGFTNELMAIVRDLPAGITALATNLPQKDGSGSLQFIAATNAPNFQGALRVVVADSVTKKERTVPFVLTTPGETGYAHLLVETNDQFWLTVRSKPAEEKKQAKKK